MPLDKGRYYFLAAGELPHVTRPAIILNSRSEKISPWGPIKRISLVPLNNKNICVIITKREFNHFSAEQCTWWYEYTTWLSITFPQSNTRDGIGTPRGFAFVCPRGSAPVVNTVRIKKRTSTENKSWTERGTAHKFEPEVQQLPEVSGHSVIAVTRDVKILWYFSWTCSLTNENTSHRYLGRLGHHECYLVLTVESVSATCGALFFFSSVGHQNALQLQIIVTLSVNNVKKTRWRGKGHGAHAKWVPHQLPLRQFVTTLVGTCIPPWTRGCSNSHYESSTDLLKFLHFQHSLCYP